MVSYFSTKRVIRGNFAELGLKIFSYQKLHSIPAIYFFYKKLLPFNSVLILLIIMLLCISTGCMGSSKATKPTAVYANAGANRYEEKAAVADKQKLVKEFPDFHLHIEAENYGVCLGPDGKNVRFLGRDASFQVTLKFDQTPPDLQESEALVANISRNLEYPLAKISDLEFQTQIIRLGALKSGLFIRPTPVNVLFKDREGKKTLLDRQGMVAIDTIPPPTPSGLRIKKKSDGYYLNWEKSYGAIKEYRIYEKRTDRWIPIVAGIKTPTAFIDQRSHGTFKIVAMDCALNKAEIQKVFYEPVIHPPLNVIVSNKTMDGFSLSWEIEAMSVDLRFALQKWDESFKIWREILSNINARQVQVMMRPEGRFRVASMNWAEMIAYSGDINLKIPKMKIVAHDRGSKILSQAIKDNISSCKLCILPTARSEDYTLNVTTTVNYIDDQHNLKRYQAECEIVLISNATRNQIVSVSEPDNNYFFGINEKDALTGSQPNSFKTKIAPIVVENFLEQIRVILR
jgi:hypothetical protein